MIPGREAPRVAATGRNPPFGRRGAGGARYPQFGRRYPPFGRAASSLSRM